MSWEMPYVYMASTWVWLAGIPTVVSRAAAGIIMLVIVRNPDHLIHVDRRLRPGFIPR